MPDDPIWYFDPPVIMWCAKHRSTDFGWTDAGGLRCAHTGCEERFWVEFQSEGAELQAARNATEEAP